MTMIKCFKPKNVVTEQNANMFSKVLPLLPKKNYVKSFSKKENSQFSTLDFTYTRRLNVYLANGFVELAMR